MNGQDTGGWTEYGWVDRIQVGGQNTGEWAGLILMSGQDIGGWARYGWVDRLQLS